MGSHSDISPCLIYKVINRIPVMVASSLISLCTPVFTSRVQLACNWLPTPVNYVNCALAATMSIPCLFHPFKCKIQTPYTEQSAKIKVKWKCWNENPPITDTAHYEKHLWDNFRWNTWGQKASTRRELIIKKKKTFSFHSHFPLSWYCFSSYQHLWLW